MIFWLRSFLALSLLGRNNYPSIVFRFFLLLWLFRLGSLLRFFGSLGRLFFGLLLLFRLFIIFTIFLFVLYLRNHLMFGRFCRFGLDLFDLRLNLFDLRLNLFDFRFWGFDRFVDRFIFIFYLFSFSSFLFSGFSLMVLFLMVMSMMFMMLVFMTVIVMFMMSFVLFLLSIFFSLFVSLTFFFIFSGMVSSGLLFKCFRDITHCCPVFSVLSLLSSHFNEKSPVADFFIERISDKIYGVDSSFEDDFEGSRIVFFDFNEFEVWESFFNILLDSIEITFDQVE